MPPVPLSTDAFRRHLEHEFPHLVNARLVLAVSGGADSVALLSLTAGVRPTVDPVAVHVHHGVRGDDADADAAFCVALCERLGVPCDVVRLPQPDDAPDGLEATWRRLRYAALEARRRARDAMAVATGHHRDDVAEGVVLQLLRGAGPRALAGIATHGPDRVIRPLLPWSRNEIEAWLRERGLAWREDASNRDPRHLRNRVRHEVLPSLEAVSPRVRDHLVHLAAAVAREQEHLDRELAVVAAWIDPWHPDGGVPVEAVARLSPALRTRWLHAQVERVGLGRATRRQSELLDGLLDRSAPRAVTLARRWRLRVAQGRLWLEPPASEVPSYRLTLRVDPATPVTPLPVPGWRLRVRSGPPGFPGDDPWRRRIAVGRELTVRPVADDDRLGDRGPRARRRMVPDIPRHLRGSWPVICEDGKLTWIPGVWQAPVVNDGQTVVAEVIRP